ncbi:PmoA family protein [Kineococcus glutinatus]|uniref:PmoA family protein n=1 Tax=Kineococcus glutinatus TaxID=1070872 RepID=A0ABP9H8F9_9ACTN
MTATATGALALGTEPGRLVVTAHDVPIATYVHAADYAAFEARKPYLHPLRTLDGAAVSAFRPHDHRWHKGLQMTATDVSGQNLWGGNTYVHGQGYIPLDNVGSMRHDSFDAAGPDGADGAVEVRERLTWLNAGGEEWAAEERSLRFSGVDGDRGLWVLDVASDVRNTRGADLVLGSPTTNGRPDAGYTGWFWRGPRGFTGGAVTAADGRGPDAMGTSSPWLAYSGQHDEVDGGATLLFFAGGAAVAGAAGADRDVPLKWFVRNDPFPAVAPSYAFDEEVVLAPGDALRLRHRLVVCSRVLDAAEVGALAAELAP